MLFPALLLATLLIPGLLICGLLRVREYRFLFAVVLSYFYFIVLLSLAGTFSFSANDLTMLYGVSLLVLGLAVFLGKRWRRPEYTGIYQQLFSTTLSIWTVVTILIFVSLYHWLFGVYDEVPSDIYQHLRYATRALEGLNEDLYQGSVLGFWEKRNIGKVWYELIAWISYISATPLTKSYPSTMVVNSLIFVLAAASCADRMFKPFALTRKNQQLAILLTGFFLISQMGINVYSYIRYYSYAPTIINFVVYFGGLVCILNLFESYDQKIRAALILLIALAVSTTVHFQEGLFLMVAIILMILWTSVAKLWQFRTMGPKRIAWPIIAFVAVIGFCVCAYIYIRLDTEFFAPEHNRIIALDIILPVFGQLYVLDPAYQFIHVVTIWGILIYFLFLINFKYFCNQPFIILGMLSPLLTVFNPVFVDMFIRLDQSTTLWRLSFFIPLHFVAGLLVVILIEKLRQASVVGRLLRCASIAMMFLLLLPSLAMVPLNAYAKLTLGKVGSENRFAYWQDFIEYLTNIENDRRILTDPITGYLIAAFTHHRSYNYKFLPSLGYYRNTFVFDDYEDFPLSRYSGKLIIVNMRNGADSLSGELSGHWHKNVLRISDYYPQNLLDHLENNPDKFEQQWQNNNIRIYYIK